MNVFVANFDDDATEEHLEELFSDYGTVQDVRIWIDFRTGKSRGFGFVEIEDEQDAESAIEKLDGKYWRGKYLRVSKARSQR